MHRLLLIIFFNILVLHASGQTTYHVTNGNNTGTGSLRQAVSDANANPGADIIVFDGDFQVTLNTPEISISGSLTITGNGINATIVDGGSVTRIFNVTSTTASLTVSNMTFQNGKILGTGGAAIATNADLTLNNVKFLNNVARVNSTSNVYGGAVTLSGNFPSTCTSCYFEGNSVTKDPAFSGTASGGAIGAVQNAHFTVTNCTFVNNMTAYGGGAIYSSADITMSGCTFTDNKASYDADLSKYNTLNGVGGALYVNGSLTLTGAMVFQNNIVAGSGGAIYKSGSGAFTTTGLTSLNINGNRAGTSVNTGFGGGIYTIVPVSFTSANNVTITNNIAFGGFGGGIYTTSDLTLDRINPITGNMAGLGGGGINVGGVLTLKDMTISNNKAGYNPDTKVYSLASSGPGGGAVQASNAVTLEGDIVMQGDTAAGYGGGFFWSAPGASYSFNTDRLNSLLISECAAVAMTYSHGGGFYSRGDVSITTVPSIMIRNNSSNAQGGGIYTASSVVNFTLANANISNNTAVSTGGGILQAGTFLTLNNSTITANKSAGGGGIYSGGTLILNNTTLSGNTSTATGGGLTVGLSVTLNNSYITGNTSTTHGGGIYGTGNVNFNSGSLTNNIANGNGGGVSMTGGTTTLTGIKVTGNTATGSGGGLYVGPGTLVLVNDTIYNNKAGYSSTTASYISGNGGGIYMTSTSALTLKGNILIDANNSGTSGAGICRMATGAVTVTELVSLVISNNGNAKCTTGGGIYTSSALTLTASNRITLRNNYSSSDGGGIYTGAVVLNLTNADLIGNLATGSGGGIYGTSDISLTNCTITDNKSSFNPVTQLYVNTVGSGGGLFSNGGVLTLNGTIAVRNNGAGGNGGGIYKTGSYNLTGLTSLTVTGNKAGKGNTSNSGNGGGIYTSASLTLSSAHNATITDNYVIGTGGGIYTSGAGVSLTLDNIKPMTNNATTVSGGAIHALGPVLLRNMTISNNKAGYNAETKVWSWQNGGGGGIYAANALTLEGALVFQGDTIAGSGGAIYKLATGAFTTTNLTSLTLTRNGTSMVSSSHGGAIYTAAALTLTAANNLSITYNTATGNGGGICTTNILTLTDIPSMTNNAATYGGAIAINAGGTLNMSGTQPLTGNTAGGGSGGGAIYNIGTLNLTNVPIIGNRSNGGGGGITIGGGTTVLTNITVSGNSSSTSGGGIYIYAGTVTLDGVTVTNNKSGWNQVTSTYGGGVGGGIAFTGGSSTLKNNILVDSNNGGDGAGIYRVGSSTVFALQSPATLTVTNNGKQFCNQGGGIFLAASTTPLTFLPAHRAIISNNNSTSNGGGMYNDNAPIDFDGVRITGNTTKGSGGGILAAGTISGQSSVRLANSVVKDNKANTASANYGGGIHGNNGVVTLINDTISGNKAGRGGGVYATNTLALQGFVVFEKDTANVDGGAVMKTAAAGTINTTGLTSLVVNSNVTLTGNGGGINTAVPLTLSAKNGVILNSNKSGGSGGGIYATEKLTVDSLTLSGNTSGNAGGAIFKGDVGLLSLKNNTFVRNSSGSNGGAVYLSINVMGSIINNSFSANNATGASSGGAVFFSPNPSVNLTIAFSTFNNNTAGSGNGHALYLGNQGVRILNGNLIYGNGTGGTEVYSPASIVANYNVARNTVFTGTTNLNLASGRGSEIFTTATGDVATLEDNGGSTQTLKIKEKGLAYNYIPSATATSWGVATIDQRGMARSSGCKTDAGAVELQVVNTPPVVTVTGAIDACTGDRVTFTVQPGLSTYQWSATPNGTMQGPGTAYQEIFTWPTTGPKTVSISVADADGCMSSVSQNININSRIDTGPVYEIPNKQ